MDKVSSWPLPHEPLMKELESAKQWAPLHPDGRPWSTDCADTWGPECYSDDYCLYFCASNLNLKWRFSKQGDILCKGTQDGGFLHHCERL